MGFTKVVALAWLDILSLSRRRRFSDALSLRKTAVRYVRFERCEFFFVVTWELCERFEREIRLERAAKSIGEARFSLYSSLHVAKQVEVSNYIKLVREQAASVPPPPQSSRSLGISFFRKRTSLKIFFCNVTSPPHSPKVASYKMTHIF